MGKTTLGWLMGRYMKLPFIALSAVSIGIKEVKEVIQKAKLHKIILFIDEFHRFNKLQQDTFLPHVENGDIILIGATTENPSFEIIIPAPFKDEGPYPPPPRKGRRGWNPQEGLAGRPGAQSCLLQRRRRRHSGRSRSFRTVTREGRSISWSCATRW